MSMHFICTNCDATVEGDLAFCPNCGTKAPEVPTSTNEDVYCLQCGSKTTAEFSFCSTCGNPLGEEKLKEDVTTESQAKPKFALPFQRPFKRMYLGIAAAVVVIALVVLVVFVMGNKSAAGNPLIYVKDKELQFLAKPSDVKSFQLTDRFIDANHVFYADNYMGASSAIFTSDNGNYVFYPDRVGDYSLTYYWRDLKTVNTKNDIATKIDSEISSLPYLTKDGNKFFYVKSDDRRLYVFDRKSGDKHKLDDGVQSFYVNESGDYLIYDTYKDGEEALYEVTIKGTTSEKNKIDSDTWAYYAFAKDKKVYYIKDDSLYVKEFGKDKVKISSDVNDVVSVVNGTSIYYLKTEEVTNKLSDFINDDMVADDRKLTEPAYPDYPVRPAYPEQYEYSELEWVDSYWGNEFNSETNSWGYWDSTTDWEAYNAAYEEYQMAYSAWEVEYNRMSNEYSVAMDFYRGKESRDNLREALGDEENAVTYNKYHLYYWTSAGETLVASDVVANGYRPLLASSSKAPVVVYNKYSMSTSGNQKLSELLHESGNYAYIDDILWDIKSRIMAIRNVSEDIYVATEAKENVLESENAVSWMVHQSGTIYFIDDYNYDKGYGALMSVAVSSGSVSKPTKVDDDVASFKFGNENSNVYYFKDVKNYKGDLYLSGKVIASDVYTLSLYNYSGSDILLYFIDYSNKNDTGTLYMYKDGTQTKIADDVTYFAPMDKKNIAYLVDYNSQKQKGDLMLYKGGGKPTLIDSDVTALLWNVKMMWGDHQFAWGWD